MTAAAARIAGRPERPSQVKRNVALAAAAALFLWALFSVEVKLERLFELPEKLGGFGASMFFPPDWSYVEIALPAMIESIQMAWVGTVIGALLSLPLGFFAAKNVSSGAISTAVRQMLNAIRAFPELILAIVIFVPIAGLGAVAGALAIGVHSIGTLGKLTAEVVEGIDPGPVEAARATGARPLQTQRWGVLPQVAPDVIAFWLYRFEINIRAAAILGVVGAGGIGTVLSNTLVYRRLDKAGLAIIVVILATILVDLASGYVRRRIIEGGTRPAHGEEMEQPELTESVPDQIDRP